jgi:hypothetical protein
MLRPDYVFLNPEQTELWFCYYPGCEETIREQLAALGEFVITRLENEERRAVFLGYAFYQTALKADVTPDTFRRLLREGKEEPVKELREKAEQPDESKEDLPDIERDFFGDSPVCREEKREWTKKTQGREKKAADGRGMWREIVQEKVQAFFRCFSGHRHKAKKKVCDAFPDDFADEERYEKEVLEEMEREAAQSRENCEDALSGRLAGGVEADLWGEPGIYDIPDAAEGTAETTFLGCPEPEPCRKPEEKALLIPKPESGRSTIVLADDCILVGKSSKTADLVLASAAVSAESPSASPIGLL